MFIFVALRGIAKKVAGNGEGRGELIDDQVLFESGFRPPEREYYGSDFKARFPEGSEFDRNGALGRSFRVKG